MAMGSKCLILLGNCGVLDRTIEIAELSFQPKQSVMKGQAIIMRRQAIQLMSTRKYKHLFKEVLNQFGYPYVEGTTWTTDACYRETREKVQRRKAQGAICVEMECAGMQALCDFRGSDFFQFFYAGDNLDHSSWQQEAFRGKAALMTRARSRCLHLSWDSRSRRKIKKDKKRTKCQKAFPSVLF